MALLADLRRKGVELRVEDGWLRFRPRSAVTPDLAARMTCHKQELVALLRAEEERDESTWPDWGSAVDTAVVFNLDGHASPPHVPCWCCSRREWWRLLEAGGGKPGPWICARCHEPGVPAEAIEWWELAGPKMVEGQDG